MTIDQKFDKNFAQVEEKMPALFIGHGSPMNAIEDNDFTRSWEALAKTLPRPKAILSISAHWETRGTLVTGMERPETIHDFGGFPRQLNEYIYDAPGSPELAELVARTVEDVSVGLDQKWGLDHGTWSVLTKMYPEADIPVVQLSLDATKNAAFHYALGNQLEALRHRGILIVGSGNIVHNLRQATFSPALLHTGYDWAVEFDALSRELILAGNHQALVDFEKLGRAARLAVPSTEHYLPLLYILALKHDPQKIHFFNEELMAGSLSMRSIMID